MPYRAQRQEGQAHPGHHGLLDGFIARHFHDDVRLDVVLGEHALHRGAGAGASFPHHELSIVQDRHRRVLAARQRMTGRAHHSERVGGEWRRGAIDAVRRSAHDDQVELVALQQIHHVFTVVNLQNDLDARKSLAELDEQHRYEIFRRADHAEIDLAVLQSAQVGDGVVELAQLCECSSGKLLHLAPGCSQANVATGCLHQWHAQCFLELPQLHRNCRLGDMQFFCRLRHRFRAGDLQEGVELSEGIAAHGSVRMPDTDD